MHNQNNGTDQTPVTELPFIELLNDLADSIADLSLCQVALRCEAFYYGPPDSSVTKRFSDNVSLQVIILTELLRRVTEAQQAIQVPKGKTQKQHIRDILSMKPDSQALRYLQGKEKELTAEDLLVEIMRPYLRIIAR